MKKLLLTGLFIFSGIIIGSIAMGKKMNEIVCKKQIEKEKFRIMYQMMERWMRVKQRGNDLLTYFDTHGYKEIAVYGIGDIGKLLLQELKESEVKVNYVIDRNTSLNCDMKIVTPDEITQEVDAIIVTAVAYFNEICDMLSQKISCPIVSLEDIVYEMR